MDNNGFEPLESVKTELVVGGTAATTTTTATTTLAAVSHSNLAASVFLSPSKSGRTSRVNTAKFKQDFEVNMLRTSSIDSLNAFKRT